MNGQAVVVIFLGILLSLNPATISLAQNENGSFKSGLEYVYNVTTSVIDDARESILTIKLKCQGRTNDIMACRLEDPLHQTIPHDTSLCKNKSMNLCNDYERPRIDNSYVGRFEIKYRASYVEELTVGSETSLKQLSFYRLMAGHIFPGVDVTDKPEGTYSLIEESLYGKCKALVKVVRSRIKSEAPESERIGKLVSFPRKNENETIEEAGTRMAHEMLSLKRTRNLETCYPVPGLLIFDPMFYHPMMTSVHYEIKSSISRIIVRGRAFTSYTTEDIAMKNTEQPDGNTTILHVRTTLTLHSIDPIEKPTAPISHPISVELPYVDGFNPAINLNDTNDDNDKNNNTGDNNNNSNNNNDTTFDKMPQ